MAYQTNIALSMNEVYDALVAFMTANGWSLYDNIPISGSRDKVLFSAGSNNRLNMYYRISTNQFGNPYKDRGDTHVKIPYIFIRGYHNWNASTHSGSGEYGEFGPLLFSGQQYSNTLDHFAYPFERGDGTLAQPLNYTGYKYVGAQGDIGGIDNTITGDSWQYGFMVQQFDGKRRFWNGSTVGVFSVDFAAGMSRDFNAGLGTQNFYLNTCAHVKDPVTDKEYIFIIVNNGTTCSRFDIDAQTFGICASAPGNISGGKMMWDGNDYIYVLAHNATGALYRYSISANSWSAMASAPTTFTSRSPGSAQSIPHCVYVPSSVTGFAEDVIYVSADSGTVIYRYDVTANAWRSTVPTGALTSPFTQALQSMLLFDGKRYLYAYYPTANVCYRSDLATSPNTWTTLGTLDSGNRTMEGATVLQFIVSKLRCNNVLTMKYFFHGDADSVRMVLRIGSSAGSGKYFWAYLGKYDTSYRPVIAGITSPVSPGVRVTVPVDDATGLVAGDTVTIANWSGSHFENTTLFSVSGSSVVCNLTSSFPSGSRLGIDPSQVILTGDTCKGTTPISFNGYRADYESDWYHVFPEVDFVSSLRNSPAPRELYIPARMKIYNGESFSVSAPTTIGSRTTNSKLETLGFLKNVYAIQQDSYPDPQNEDVLTIGDSQYIYFSLQHNALVSSTGDKRGIVIGPIS